MANQPIFVAAWRQDYATLVAARANEAQDLFTPGANGTRLHAIALANDGEVPALVEFGAYDVVGDDVEVDIAPGSVADLQTHDLAAETDLAVRLDALAVDRAEARRLRAERYAREMPVGDQLDAVLKTLDSLREGGAELPAETEALIERWLAIKTDHPKPELLPAPAVTE